MNILDKVRVLGDAAKYDTCASSASPRKVDPNNLDRIGNAAEGGICHSFGQDGRCISLYKTLMANSCSYDCKYCNNAGCTNKATSFTPNELAKVFMSLYVKNYVEGLFLSSGVVKDPDKTTQNMIDAINLIRKRYNFQGYIHFKIIPGTSYELIKQATEFSDRVSVNLEAPSKQRLNEISSTKDFKIDILRRQAWIKRMNIPAGQTTQLVVGGSDETDLEILRMVNWEYENLQLKRGYYSAFIPVESTPFAKKEMTPLHREHRLYNVDFMLRKYNFRLKDFKRIMDDGMLPKEDPKLVLARETFDSPIEVNEASYDDLLRVPGIGPLSAKRISIMNRAKNKITKYEQLKNIGVVLKRAREFIKVDGKHQKSLTAFV